jgi:hypothetical protein
LLRQIFTTEADLLPDEKEATLTVSLHHLANASSDHLVQELSQPLNVFPGYQPAPYLEIGLLLKSSGSGVLKLL